MAVFEEHPQLAYPRGPARDVGANGHTSVGVTTPLGPIVQEQPDFRLDLDGTIDVSTLVPPKVRGRALFLPPPLFLPQPGLQQPFLAHGHLDTGAQLDDPRRAEGWPAPQAPPMSAGPKVGVVGLVIMPEPGDDGFPVGGEHAFGMQGETFGAQQPVAVAPPIPLQQAQEFPSGGLVDARLAHPSRPEVVRLLRREQECLEEESRIPFHGQQGFAGKGEGSSGCEGQLRRNELQDFRRETEEGRRFFLGAEGEEEVGQLSPPRATPSPASQRA
ncbi:hypothetical protein XANCAGTX0491_002226 [Xanthoria calcicola]